MYIHTHLMLWGKIDWLIDWLIYSFIPDLFVAMVRMLWTSRTLRTLYMDTFWLQKIWAEIHLCVERWVTLLSPYKQPRDIDHNIGTSEEFQINCQLLLTQSEVSPFYISPPPSLITGLQHHQWCTLAILGLCDWCSHWPGLSSPHLQVTILAGVLNSPAPSVLRLHTEATCDLPANVHPHESRSCWYSSFLQLWES